MCLKKFRTVHNENFGCPNSETSELSKFGRFFRTFVGKSRIQSLQKMIKGHSVCHKLEVYDSLLGPNFQFLVFKYHTNYHRPQSYGGERLQWLTNHNFFSTYSTAWPCRFVADKKESIRKKCLNIANDLCSYANHSQSLSLFRLNFTKAPPGRVGRTKKLVAKVVVHIWF